MIRRRLGALAILALTAAAAFGTSAWAQATAGFDVKIREIAFDSTGLTRLTVSVSGASIAGQGIAADNLQVTESGQPIPSLRVERFGASGTQGIAVALVMDVSGSTAGDALAAAKEAAKGFVTRLPDGVRVALVSFGQSATVRVPLTADRGQVTRAIDGLQAGGRTALYDGIALAGETLERVTGAQRNIVVFSDGNDTVSRASLAQAQAAIRDANAPATTVLLSTDRVDREALESLADAETGGRFLTVDDASGLNVAFARVAQAISSQYVVSYPGTDLESKELELAVSVTVGGATATDSAVVINDRTAPQPEAGGGEPIVPGLSNSLGLYLGIGAAFAAILLFVLMLAWRPAGKRAERMLARGLKMYTRADRREKQRGEDGMFGGTAVGRRAVELAERVPRSKGFDEKMQKQLDQAGWPLRSTEFILIQVGAALLGAVLGFGLLGRWWLGIMLGVFGAIVPRLALSNQMTRRSAAFLSQLPDTLQLLSGSLQAGYGFLQAIDTVAKEAAPPTSQEFSRVLSEARLGMPIEEALDTMADRVGGEDFKWVVLAINIQRQVGGNLATLLQTVANTLREREQVRRQIKVLSAEGRLSAVILVALPFVLFGYISIVNPEYIGELTGATLGRIAIGVALVLIGIGVVWMRKIIKIDV